MEKDIRLRWKESARGKDWESCGESNVKSKAVDKKNIEESMDIVGLNETLDKLAKANWVRRYGYERVLRTENDDVLREALQYEVAGTMVRNRMSEQNMEKASEEKSWENSLKKEDTYDRARWREAYGWGESGYLRSRESHRMKIRIIIRFLFPTMGLNDGCEG